jgi:hypothetical protein
MGTGTSCTCLRNDIPMRPHQQKQDGCSSKEQPSQPVKEPLISRAARRSRQRVLGAVCKKEKHHLLRWCFSGAGDEARTRYLDLGKVALYQMSYARKRKIDYNPAGGICQPLRSAFFSFFSG